ncbi:hypothetical protein [Micromonospora sp. NPDC005652]|uniref:hypothetical protein n=1 Tax=Micromonospora sp. NPDC005652 TaxID=3157046 RepID=UPI003403E664
MTAETGLAGTPAPALEAIRLNLHQGLRLVLAHRDAGTLHRVGPKGAAPPIESGALTLSLLIAVDEELAHRMNAAAAPKGSDDVTARRMLQHADRIGRDGASRQ